MRCNVELKLVGVSSYSHGARKTPANRNRDLARPLSLSSLNMRPAMTCTGWKRPVGKGLGQ
eukprot:13839604-Alexandrium_andersonii.AAC.1